MSAIEWIKGATLPVVDFTYESVDITGYTITLHIGTSTAAALVSKAATLTDPTNGVAQVTFGASDFDSVTPGTYDAEWEVDDGAGGVLRVGGFSFIVKASVEVGS